MCLFLYVRMFVSVSSEDAYVYIDTLNKQQEN